MKSFTPKDAAADIGRLRLVQLAALVNVEVHAKSLDWPEVAALMLGNMARMSRSIASLHDDFRYDAAVLARSLFEHATKFSWLAIDPPTHFDRWCRSDIRKREKTINDAKALGVAEVANVAAPAGPETDDEVPPMPQMCDAVDAFWSPKLPGGAVLKRHSFRGLYLALYRQFSGPTHGDGMAIQALVHIDADRTLHADFSAPTLASAFTVTPIVLASALLIAQQALGHPEKEDILGVFGETVG